MNTLFLTDFYKLSHGPMYPEGLTKLVTYWTPRKSRMENVDKVVMFGLQSFIKEYLIKDFQENFFNKDINAIIGEFEAGPYRLFPASITRDMTKRIKELHELKYLPIEIKALDEGELVNIGVPMIQITNTDDRFAWLVNYLETLVSCYMWQPMTSATIGYEYRKIINKYFEKTSCESDCRPSYICGDFSMRGMSSIESSITSAAGFLLSFSGTSTIPVIPFLKDNYSFYNVDELVATPATEHSIMSAYGRDNEYEAYDHLINDVMYGRNSNISIVSDTYDYWNVLTDYLNRLHDDIMLSEGKVIIRGDSGDPCDIICGDKNAPKNSPEYKGTVEILWEIFGGEVNEKGYKVLDNHIGVIYGDGITLQRCEEICRRLEEKQFAISNIALGVGSFSLQYNTRDTFGFAMKATDAIIRGHEYSIYKEPKTDKDNFKKSHRGICKVYRDEDGELRCKDQLTLYHVDNDNMLKTVFKNGVLYRYQSFDKIRDKLHGGKF